MNREPPGCVGPVGSSGRPPGAYVDIRPPGYTPSLLPSWEITLPPGASPSPSGDLSEATSPSTPITPPHAMIIRAKPVGTIPRASAPVHLGERPCSSLVPRVRQVQFQPDPTKNETTSSPCMENTSSPAAAAAGGSSCCGRSSGPNAARAVGSADPPISLSPSPKAGRHLCDASDCAQVLSAHRGWFSFFDKLFTRAVVADAFAVCDTRAHSVPYIPVFHRKHMCGANWDGMPRPDLLRHVVDEAREKPWRMSFRPNRRRPQADWACMLRAARSIFYLLHLHSGLLWVWINLWTNFYHRSTVVRRFMTSLCCTVCGTQKKKSNWWDVAAMRTLMCKWHPDPLLTGIAELTGISRIASRCTWYCRRCKGQTHFELWYSDACQRVRGEPTLREAKNGVYLNKFAYEYNQVDPDEDARLCSADFDVTMLDDFADVW